MTRQNVNVGSTANDGTGDTLRVAGTKINQNFVELYSRIGGEGVSFDSNHVVFEGLVTDAHQTSLGVTNPTKDNTIELPDSSGAVILDNAVQTLKNKTLNAPTLIVPEINNPAGTYQYVIAPSAIGADRNVTLPLLTGNDEITFNAHTQTLTKKTLNAPTINTPKIKGDILDSNGVEIITLSSVGGGATNEVTISNSAAATGPNIAVTGTPANTNLRVNAAGTGSVVPNKLAIQSFIADSDAADDQYAFKNAGYIIGNKGSALALTLADGTTIGEYKIFTNKGAGTMTVTPSNYAQGTSFAIPQNDSCAQLIWDGTNWNRM